MATVDKVATQVSLLIIIFLFSLTITITRGTRWCSASAYCARDPGSIPECGTLVMSRPSGASDEAPGHGSFTSKVSLGGPCYLSIQRRKPNISFIAMISTFS